MTTITVTETERDAILAGLRLLQDTILGESPGDDYLDIASNGGTHALIEIGEIDDLCERVNQ